MVDRMVRVDEELLEILRQRYPEWKKLNFKQLVDVALRMFLKRKGKV